MDKRVKSKNDFIQTSSSIKDKCGIRIRKSKKTTWNTDIFIIHYLNLYEPLKLHKKGLTQRRVP